jgi:hypothetical protein
MVLVIWIMPRAAVFSFFSLLGHSPGTWQWLPETPSERA